MNTERTAEILDRLPKLVFSLDPNPTARGPVYLQELIYQVRNGLNETGVFLQEVLRWKSGLESRLEALEVAFQVDSDELLANDKRVNGLPAIQDRLAMINVLLRDQRKVILELKKEVNDAGHIEKAVRHRHRELENTMSAIRLQRSLIETEIRTGSFYGDESDTSRGKATWGRKQPKDNDIDEEELSKLMESMEQGGTEAEDEEEDLEVEEGDEEEESEGEEEETEEETGESEGENPETLAEPVAAKPSPAPPASRSRTDDLFGDLGLFDDDVSLDGAVPLVCSECGEPQFETPSGMTCKNGHGGVVGLSTPPPIEAAPAQEAASLDESDLPDSQGAEKDAEKPEDPDITRFLDGDTISDDDLSDIFGSL